MNVIQRLAQKRILLVLVLAFVLVSGVAATAQAAPPETAVPATTQTATTAPQAQWHGVYHTVRYGETLSSIARAYGTTVQAIMAANPQIWNPNLIFAGSVLFIPQGQVPPPPPPPPTYCRFYHTVTYGDTLNRISAWYGVDMWTIAQANRIFNLNLIYRGQVLCIP